MVKCHPYRGTSSLAPSAWNVFGIPVGERCDVQQSISIGTGTVECFGGDVAIGGHGGHGGHSGDRSLSSCSTVRISMEERGEMRIPRRFFR